MKKLLKKIEGFFVRIFGKEFSFLKKNSALAVRITNILKAAVENPLGDIVTGLIPGNVDNEILYKLRQIVPKVTAQVAIAHGIIQASDTNANMTSAIIQHLKGMNPNARVGFWLEFSGRINEALSDGKLTFAEAVALAQIAYVEFKNPE